MPTPATVPGTVRGTGTLAQFKTAVDTTVADWGATNRLNIEVQKTAAGDVYAWTISALAVY
jgi:hypothetical protein